MDVTAYLEPRIAPRAIFDSLSERRSRVRYRVPGPKGIRQVTWGEHADEIRNIAVYLASEIDSGDRAAIFAPNRVEWMSAALATQAAGGVMVPVYPSCTAEQAAYVIAHSDARVVFVDTKPLLDRVLSRLDDLASVRRVVTLDDALAETAGDPRVIAWSRALSLGAARDREEPDAFMARMDAVSLDQPGLMLYTSGTSGPPKGVPLTHANVAASGRDWLLCMAPILEEGYDDLLWLPMSHIFGFGEACLGNTLGWTSTLADPVTVMARLPEVRPQVFMSVPVVWDKLAQLAMQAGDPAARVERLREVTGGRLRFCLSGGAGLKREVKELFHQAGILIIEGYGLTECSPTLTLNRPGDFRFDSVGKPLPSVELRLAEDGEILARGPNVFAGYHKDAEATRAVFSDDGWLCTGDVGRLTEDGFLQIVDRKKDILVTAGGKNVAPANIEVRMADDPFITHAVVYGDGRKYLVAGVWLDDAAVRAHLADVTDEAVQALVQERIDGVNATLARYETIKRFRVFDAPLTVEGGMLTPTLKVRRKKVYERFGPELDALYEA